jgi:hypothetical protein
LELEIELQKLTAESSASGFTSQEEKEFQYIYHKLDEPREISIRFYNDDASGKVIGKFSFLKLFSSFISSAYIMALEESDLEGHVLAELKKIYPDKGYVNLELSEDPSAELRTYGFVELRDYQTQDPFRGLEYQLTPRLYRFRFWLEVNELSGETPMFDITDAATQVTETK